MKAAQITEWNQVPKYVDIAAPPAPDADSVQIKVLAAGLHRVVRGRATGQHFSATKLPHIPGSDGVGRTVPDGKLVYFSTFWEKGSFAEYVNVAKSEVTDLPAGSDPVLVAGLINPGMSSWMAIKTRTSNLPPNFSVLILGGTSTSGTVALSLARSLGAGKIIGCARNVAAMQALGYDDTIALENDVEKTDFSKAANVDVILDYLYGPPTSHLFKSLKPTTPVQYVQIGTMVSTTVELPGDLMRAKDLTIRGSAPGSFTAQQLAAEMPNLIQAVGRVQGQKFKTVSLKDIESAWPDMKNRLIVTFE